jgi:hypothetical protein
MRSSFESDADVAVESADFETAELSEWLHETYFDDGKPPYFTETDLKAVGEVLQRLLRFRPSECPSADNILLESSFGDRTSVERGKMEHGKNGL